MFNELSDGRKVIYHQINNINKNRDKIKWKLWR